MRLLALLPVGLLLVGCSAGPGKGDVEKALGQFFQQNAGIEPTFDDLEIGKCEKPDTGPGYACSVSGTAQFTLGTRTQSESLTGTFVFDEVGGQWKVVGTR